MSRPGFILDVDESTSPTLIWRGNAFTRERLPSGSRVIYAPEPVAGVPQAEAAVRSAVSGNIDGDRTLASLLEAGSRLTIAMSDNAASVVSRLRVDPRQYAIEAALDIAAAAGVDDVVIVVARGLRRRLHDFELRRITGPRVFDALEPRGLLQHHDAENPDELAPLSVEDGSSIAVNKRVVESDVVVFVNLATSPSESGLAAVAGGLLGATAVMDESVTASQAESAIGAATQLVQADLTMNNDVFGDEVSFLQRREWEWRARDRFSYGGMKQLTEFASRRARRKLFQSLISPAQLSSVAAGRSSEVHNRTRGQLRAQLTVDIPGQSDVVSVGVPFAEPHSANSIANPVLVAAHGVALATNTHGGASLVRDGGVVIIHHPMAVDFHTVHHPSYIDFFDTVLGETTDPVEIRAKYQERFATDAWYSHVYRQGHAFHGVHPLLVWYELCRAVAQLGAVIFVSANVDAVRRLGFRPASTLQDAMEIARDVTGTSTPSLTHLHVPPALVANVTS